MAFEPNEITWQGQETLEKINALLEEGKSCAVYGMPNSEYHSHKSISSSGIRKFHDLSPDHFYHASPFNPDFEYKEPRASKALELGKAMHHYLLERDTFFDHYIVKPHAPDYDALVTKDDLLNHAAEKNIDVKPSWSKTKVEQAVVKADPDVVLYSTLLAAHQEKLDEGALEVTKDELDMLKAMGKRLDQHPFAGGAFMHGDAEVSLFWVDAQTGLWCRCRPDFLPHVKTRIPDFKTCRSAKPSRLQFSIADYGYYSQDPWYLDGIQMVFGKRPKSFFFVFQESAEPYPITVALLSADSMSAGEMVNRRTLQRMKACFESGVWPSYTDKPVTIDLPFRTAKELDEFEQTEFPEYSDYEGDEHAQAS